MAGELLGHFGTRDVQRSGRQIDHVCARPYERSGRHLQTGGPVRDHGRALAAVVLAGLGFAVGGVGDVGPVGADVIPGVFRAGEFGRIVVVIIDRLAVMSDGRAVKPGVFVTLVAGAVVGEEDDQRVIPLAGLF